MLKHHEVEFHQFIDRLVRSGASSAHWESVYTWFNTSRITKNVWRQIHAQYVELCEHYEWEGPVPALHALRLESFLTLTRDRFDGESRDLLTETGLDESTD
ncbi:hypothetical protein [Stenotrophomonas maltophilia]|uniref:hypothetical protein n=1 Tax=Stenotrophomonas maltophilia TaxID=40324 RepID=UPI00027A6EBA|nr:hypothetical protein [Stenotrophomonas maltophilia]EJP76852.1 hypothetical protein A1OC_01655 [Stenotrophomonas maltophilia Ab55555]ELE7120583.1 hypothetical protein [Stenotrophomonas maltophilia]HDS3802340.1 hypothetical protein [Stenotrophomonas maltophilia]HDX0866166.1 hypothetical protein [Stenotrophomonas maltophilia]HEL4208267.1 hypothetical protein [Stenotrophomonas maltophilia]